MLSPARYPIWSEIEPLAETGEPILALAPSLSRPSQCCSSGQSVARNARTHAARAPATARGVWFSKKSRSSVFSTYPPVGRDSSAF